MPIKSKGIALPRLNRKFWVRANNGRNIASAANNEELMRVSRTIAQRVCTDNSLLSLQLFSTIAMCHYLSRESDSGFGTSQCGNHSLVMEAHQTMVLNTKEVELLK